MSGADIIVSLIILAVVGVIVAGMIKKHKSGGCSCGCSGCGGSCPGHTGFSEKKP